MGDLGFLLLLVALVYLAIALHELGHYAALRRFGVAVRVVAFGGPPWVLRWRRGGTEFRLGLLPLFAFVDPEEAGLKRLPRRLFVAALLAGPAANLGAALLGGLVLALVRDEPGAFLQVLGVVLAFPVLMVQVLYGLVQAGGDAVVGFREFASVSVGMLKGGLVSGAVYWTALNAALGWFNLLPVPPLDGGQVLGKLVEHRPWFGPVYRVALVVGVGLNVGLLLLALLKDLGLLGLR